MASAKTACQPSPLTASSASSKSSPTKELLAGLRPTSNRRSSHPCGAHRRLPEQRMRLRQILMLFNPRDEQFPDHRQHNGAEKQATDPIGDGAPDNSDQNDQHRRIQSASHNEG